MISDTTSMMPMGAAALKNSTPPAPPLPPLTAPPSAGAGPMPLPPPPAMPPAPGAAAPIPRAPVATPPWSVRPQPDGSSVYYMPSPDGDPSKEVILGVNPPPKLPKALQPPKPSQPQLQ